MNAIVQTLNTAGRAFVDFAVPMLIQSSLLVLILLAVDAVLRKRVRAVFRYWIWMLVLVKLVLPPSLWSPVSVGTWLGDRLEVSTTALLEHVSRSSSPRSEGETPSTPQGQDALATKLSPAVTNIFSQPPRMFVEPPLLDATVAPPSPAPMETAQKPALIDVPPALFLNWQGLVLLVWIAVVTALLLLLAQRTFFVQGLVAQADEANGVMLRELAQCGRHLGLRRPISLRLSPHAASPAVCGLLRPTILVPQTLASRLHGADLQAVLFHELAHVKRGDLWINVIQTLLQIAYFYNPLLWLANTAIRRVREKAVDETVLVAMGEAAPQYPETLVHVAKLAFARRPALSLRLIGVVESKSALTSRIKHILNRPLPKTAKLGGLGLIAVLITAAVLLPMARVEAGPTPIRGIEENLDLSDQSGHLRLRSLHMAPPDGKRIVGMNETSLAVQVENTAPQEAYLGLEYYADAGSVAAGAFSPGASSRTQVRPVPPHWQGTLTYPISYVRFVKNGYIQIRLAKCRNAQTKVFASPEAEVLYDKKYSIFADEDLQTIEPTEDSSAANLNRNESSIRESHDALANSTVAQDQSHDSDGDGLSDYDEIHKYLTDPAKKDSDGDGIPDSDWNERREYTYSVRTVLRYLPPVDEKALNDDFQDGRVLKQTDEYIEVEVIHYPLATGYDSIPENRNWRLDDAQMREYLAPGATTNWDEPMQRDLIAALKADGIDVDTLTDKQVVERVSRWLLDRSRSLDKVFTTYYVHFPQGKPTVYPGLEDAFRGEFERDKSNYNWTLDQHLDHEVLGKGMFYNKTHGSCTSTAIYLTTVLRALGIPTRMVVATPAVDASDREQILMVKNAITHNRVRMTMLAGLGRSSHGFTNHTFNEVYVGNRWCRLDYTQLGCSNFGLHRFGLQTHVYTCNDWSDINLAPTWGRRYAKGEHSDVFQHDNPYTAVEVSEQFGLHGKVPNPPFTAQELDPHPQPDIFLFYPSRGGGVWDAFVDIVRSTTANKTGRYQLRESYENLSGGTWLIRPQDILVLLFALDTPERVPEGYEDLLPKPWAEIEAQLKQDQTVELGGKARGMNVILLATPTADGLKPLVQNSKLLRAIGGASPAPGVDPTQPPAVSQSAAKPVKLANGATVELLGICEYPSEGKQWWRPDGSPLSKPPYDKIDATVPSDWSGARFEFAVRLQNLPEGAETTLGADHASATHGTPSLKTGARQENLRWLVAVLAANRSTCTVKCGVAAEPWRTVARTSGAKPETHVTGEGATMFTEVRRDPQRGTNISVTDDIVDGPCRIVAVTQNGNVEVPSESHSGSAGKARHTTVYFPQAPTEIQEYQFQIRSWTWVEFENVSLRPDRKAEEVVKPAEVKTLPVSTAPFARQGKVVGLGPAWEVLKEVLGPRYWGSIGGFSRDPAQTKQYFDQLLARMSPGDTFVLMFAFDQPVGVPPEDADLLPPWAEIENRIRKGQTVEAQGQARDLTVIVLAAPTSGQLDTLVRQTHLLDPYRPEAAQGPTVVSSSQTLAQLPNGVTVELLGAGAYGSEGKPWWRPDGAPLATAPYDGIVAGGATPNNAEKAPFWLAVRVGNLPEGWEARVGSPDVDNMTSDNRPSKAGQPQDDLRWMLVEADPNQTTCTVRCDVSGLWQTVARGSLRELTARSAGLAGITLSRVYDVGTSMAAFDVTTRLAPGTWRVVAITREGQAKEQSPLGSSLSNGTREATVYIRGLSLADVKELQFQTRPVTRVEFRNVPLQPGLQMNVEVQVRPVNADVQAASPAHIDAEKRIVLPEADRQPVVLDLATSELVPLPLVGPEPQKLEQALQKLGKGDLLYDCDSGDRTLILMRGATSEQAQGDTGEPPWKGYLIGPYLPGVLTIKTTEGRQYKVTILAADDAACTLQYSLISTDQGAGGGAPVEPAKAANSLELRIAPRQGELGPDAVQEYRKALADGRSLAESRCLWATVRPDMKLSPDLVTQTREGKTWLLVYNENSSIMVPAQGWRLVHVGRNTDENGRPMLVLRFDDAGATQMVRLTTPHAGQLLAVILGGVVVSTPTIPERQDGSYCATITGAFTERELGDMMGILRQGMIEPSTPSTGDFRPIRLSNGVIVELLGVCEHPSIGKSWWRPDGSPLTERPYDDDDGRAFPKPGEKGYKLAVRFSGLAGKNVGAYVIPSNSKTTNGGTLAQISEKNGKKNAEYLNDALDQAIVWQGVAFDAELDSCDIRVGVSQGPWKSAYGQEAGQSSDAVEWAIFRDVSLRPRRQIDTGRSAGGGAPAEPAKAASPLAFRIAPKLDEVGSEKVQRYKQALVDGSQMPAGTFAWFEIRPGTVLVPDQITCEHGGKTYLLLWNDQSHVMLADETWRLEDVRETPYEMGNRAITLTMDESGVQLLHKLGDANLRHYMAVVFEERVIAIPFISTTLAGKGLPIIGRFTPEEVNQIITALKETMPVPTLPPTPPQERSGRVVDPNGRPVAGAQVALCTEDRGLTILTPKLLPTDLARKTSAIVETDAEGRFSFPEVPADFAIIAAHETGFARVDGSDFVPAMTIRLERWGQIEGTLYVESKPAPDEVMTLSLGAQHSYTGYIRYDHRADTKVGGRFVFRQVVPGWLEIGHSVQVNGRTYGSTNRRPIYVKPGQTLEITLGNTGRPVIGTLALPPDDSRPANLTWDSRWLETVRPKVSEPVGFDQMTGSQKGQWFRQWGKTPQGRAYFEAAYHDPNRRSYSFSINEDDSFRMEDVIPGRYQLMVSLSESAVPGSPVRRAGPYFATIEVPPMAEPYTNEPLDLGTLTLTKDSNVDSSQGASTNEKSAGRDNPLQTPAKPETPEAPQNGDRLKQMLAAARPWSVVTIPAGRYTAPVEITQPLTLRGESTEGCIIEVTADQPALAINTQGRGQVAVENLTIRWQLASGNKVELPAAVLVKGTNAVIRNCRFASLGDVKRSPMAVYIDGKSESTVDNCRSTGFDYVVCYGSGTEGVVQDCVIADCGHQGVIGYDGSTLTVQRNIITGSKFHAVRCTGGTLHVKDNLLIKNANRGIYLGNRTGRGTITNNLIVGNGSGISAFGRADYVVANNVILNNSFSGIDMRDSCRLSIRNNVLGKNQRGLALFKEGTENFNVVAPNVFWANATDAESLEKPAGSITADPQFADPNHGDFTLRAPAREQGYGLTNPQILKDLWQRYEELQSKKDRVSQPQKPTRDTTAAPAADNAAQAGLAWQRTDRYVPPDPNGFFPNDPQAGQKLDALSRAADRDQRSDDEILSTVRQGLRTAQHRQDILQWIGGRYVWNKDPQNPQAIEIMYHASPLEPSSAVYAGLAVVRDKPANVLRTLADLCLQGEDVGRITWGIGAQREQLLSYITPYLHDQDPAKQQMAAALVKHFQGELNFESWLAAYRVRQGQLQFGPQLAQFKETLRTGGSETRYQTLTTIGHNRKWVEILDDSFLPVLQTVSADPDRRVRNEVASLAGYRWLWVTPAQPQDPSVIELMLQLSADSDRQVRYNAVYYGLSAVRDKSEPVVRRLIQLAMTDPDTDLFGRIAWSLRNSMNTGRQLFERTWAGALEAATTDAQRAAIRRLYKEVLGQEPPATSPSDQKPAALPANATSRALSGRVVDPNGNPVVGAQVALCTKDKGVDIQAGQLLPTKWGGKGGEIVKTDAQGRFSFAAAPDEFNLIAAHDTGFAWVTSKDLAASGDLRLEPWSRIEGTLKIGRELGAGERISLQRGGNRSAADQNIHFDYETYADSGGRFTFARVPPTWMEVGYMIQTGDSTSSDTGRTPIHLLPGQNLKVTLGGEGRPVIGKFVPPQGYKGPVYFGEGLRALQTWHPDLPKPANYDQMTRREQQQWRSEWTKTPQAEAYYDALWHNLNRRHYTFRIQNDGTFRIEDVIPGQYQFTVWLEERLSGQSRPEEIGAYYGTVEVPALPGGRTDEPLDLGNLTLAMRNPPLHVGDMAPLFEAKSLDGKDVRLIDCRGKFVLLSFWQPTFHPELDRLQELYQTYSGAGKLAIVDFAGGDTLEEVTKYLAEHKTEWPEIYLGQNWDSDIFKQYGDPSASYILLVNPEGKIVATWLRGEKLTETVKDALGPIH